QSAGCEAPVWGTAASRSDSARVVSGCSTSPATIRALRSASLHRGDAPRKPARGGFREAPFAVAPPRPVTWRGACVATRSSRRRDVLVAPSRQAPASPIVRVSHQRRFPRSSLARRVTVLAAMLVAAAGCSRERPPAPPAPRLETELRFVDRGIEPLGDRRLQRG